MDAFSGSTITFPLALATCGEKVQIVSVMGGRGMDRKLADLGLYAGETVTVLSSGGGPLLLARGDARLAIGSAMSFRILVSRVAELDASPVSTSSIPMASR